MRNPDAPTPTPRETLARLTPGTRVRWDEPMYARRHAHDTDPHCGEGVIEVGPDCYGGVVVSYVPWWNKDSRARAYYTTGYTFFEILAD